MYKDVYFSTHETLRGRLDQSVTKRFREDDVGRSGNNGVIKSVTPFGIKEMI